MAAVNSTAVSSQQAPTAQIGHSEQAGGAFLTTSDYITCAKDELRHAEALLGLLEEAAGAKSEDGQNIDAVTVWSAAQAIRDIVSRATDNLDDACTANAHVRKLIETND